jgi:hypothetical protein
MSIILTFFYFLENNDIIFLEKLGDLMRNKYCKYCGETIPGDAVVCTHCGRQVEVLKTTSQVVLTGGLGQPKDKIVALLLCFFLGFLGVHKFYEGKVGMGVLYLFTMGLFGIGVLVDFIVLLFKPSIYYV